MPKAGPEEVIVQDIIKYLKARNWHVMRTHGNEYQKGFPDLWAMHEDYRWRWIEVKNPKAYSFTKAQLASFHLFAACGIGIWIMTCADAYEYNLLLGQPNWHQFLGKSSHSRGGK